MRKAVVNGAFEHPGANWVTDEFGRRRELEKLSRAAREALARSLMTTPADAPAGSCKVYIIPYHTIPYHTILYINLLYSNLLYCTKLQPNILQPIILYKVVGRHLVTGDVLLANR